jgi:hypothetical protein
MLNFFALPRDFVLEQPHVPAAQRSAHPRTPLRYRFRRNFLITTR